MPLTTAPYARLHFPFITPFSWESIGNELLAMNASGGASTAWPAANLAILVPFSTWQTLSIKGVAWYNGTTVGGNCDVGIYDSTAVNRLTSLGTTARGTVSNIVTTTLSTYVLAPGDYYMALSTDGTPNMLGPAPAAGLCAAMGVLEAPTAFVLPSTLSPVLTTRAFIPVFGLLTDSAAV